MKRYKFTEASSNTILKRAHSTELGENLVTEHRVRKVDHDDVLCTRGLFYSIVKLIWVQLGCGIDRDAIRTTD